MAINRRVGGGSGEETRRALKEARERRREKAFPLFVGIGVIIMFMVAIGTYVFVAFR